MPLLMKGYPIDTYECPTCKFPLDVHFVESGFTRKRIEVHVGCSKCCWTEYWGTYTPQSKEGEIRVHLEPGTTDERPDNGRTNAA